MKKSRSFRALAAFLAAFLMPAPPLCLSDESAPASPPDFYQSNPAHTPDIRPENPPPSHPRFFRKKLKKAAHKMKSNVIHSLARGLFPLQSAVTVGCDYALMFLPSDNHLPPNLKGKDHADFLQGMRWVPRGLTSFQWGEPRMIVGHQTHRLRDKPLPIGEQGSFQISRYPRLPVPFCWMPLYFAFTTKGGYHMRLGARWDDVDNYTQIPSIAHKRLKR